MRTVIAVLCSQSGLTIIVPRPSEPAGGRNLENKNVYIVYGSYGNESSIAYSWNTGCTLGCMYRKRESNFRLVEIYQRLSTEMSARGELLVPFMADRRKQITLLCKVLYPSKWRQAQSASVGVIVRCISLHPLFPFCSMCDLCPIARDRKPSLSCHFSFPPASVSLPLALSGDL